MHLVKKKAAETPEDSVEIGQWYWTGDEDDGARQIWCVTYVGTNYVELRSVCGSFQRVHFDKFHSITERELNPDDHIESMIQLHKKAVNLLLDEIKQLTARLGLTPTGELPPHGETQNALVVAHGTKNINAHKKALIKAKEKTLPDLFKQVEVQHDAMATWMKAKLIPMKAEMGILKNSTETIEDRIFTVELYAGLCEELVTIRNGEPAGNDDKIHLFQRRHYMDEECLLDYKAGGMEFKDICAFDRWLMKKGNRNRILPMPKCVVAFRVRRKSKERDAVSLHQHIRFMKMQDLDKLTFLYIRNGDRYYRMSTHIDFGPELFPDEARTHLIHGQLYIKNSYYDPDFITEREYLCIVEDRKRRKKEHRAKVAAWKKMSKAEKAKTDKPWYYESHDQYEPLSPASVYYDDVMKKIGKQARDHNRIAVVLQGLLDRSLAFHPHPPWRLWTAEGFDAGIELVHDNTHAIADGDPPDFETYRARLNARITKGTHTVGQHQVWLRAEAKKENERQARDWRIRKPHPHKSYSPYGNDGPGEIAIVTHVSRDKSTCKFSWERERLCHGWVPDPDRPGWRKREDSPITTHFKCSSSKLLNVDAYTRGDYKQFYEDPRTRADYLKWAPLLLAAEDYQDQ